MRNPEEKYNTLCDQTTKFLREGKLNDAYGTAKTAFETAVHTAQFASSEERPKWIFRADKMLEITEGIDAELKKKTSQKAKLGAEGSNGVDASGMTLAIRPRERLSDVSGMQEAKDEVRLSVLEPLRKPEKAKKYGLKLGGGLLLYGLPGTGKTFFARAVAGELNLPFYVIRSSDILNKYLGESEKIIKGIFDAARKNPMSVIFIDETNGLLPDRNGEGVHAVSQRVEEIILEETDGIDSKEKNPFLLIGATNYPAKLDDAALGRFASCIEVELPDADTRRFILNRELGAMEISVATNALEYLVEKTDSFSCRDLVNLAAYFRKCAAKDEISDFSLDFCKQNFKDVHVNSVKIAEGIAQFKKRIGVVDLSEKKK